MGRGALNIKWYQDAVINGKSMPFRRSKSDTTTIRWEKLIEPLITDGSVFVDFGCNAGFCCREMVDRGFISYGVEVDPTYLDCARYWEKHDPKGIKIINKNVHDYDMPCADIVLMAFFHYWQTHEELVALEKRLRKKAVNVIFVTRYRPVRRYKSPPYKEYLIGLFRKWDITGELNGEKYTSIKFTNKKLFTVPIDSVNFHPIHGPRAEKKGFPLSNGLKFKDVFLDFIKKVDSGKPFDPKATQNFEYIKSWEPYYGKEIETLEYQLSAVKSILKDGIKDPCLLIKDIRGKGRRPFIRDGNHRMALAKYLGMKHLVCRRQIWR